MPSTVLSAASLAREHPFGVYLWREFGIGKIQEIDVGDGRPALEDVIVTVELADVTLRDALNTLVGIAEEATGDLFRWFTQVVMMRWTDAVFATSASSAWVRTIPRRYGTELADAMTDEEAHRNALYYPDNAPMSVDFRSVKFVEKPSRAIHQRPFIRSASRLGAQGIQWQTLVVISS